ncbi:MAG: zinc ribbon domain-containing protein [Verrucomicrobia bacterium]|nr:zinc ribbon domain-containing protein [Verrucomicrobiota bacterium]
MAPETCPNCGADVPRNAKACPECGACERTGWSEEAHDGALGLPDDSFDYEDYVRKEFGGRTPVPRGVHPVWWVTAILLLVAWLAWYFWR